MFEIVSNGLNRMSTALTSPRDTVLIIDDDAAVLASLKFALEVEGFAVEVFHSAEELLERPAPPASSCLVVDFRLPAMDGVELVSTLRGRGVTTPAILITTDPPQKVRLRATEEGLAIVEKPLLGNTLAEAIRTALRA